ncbi:hypothetical protein BCR43DRAFT_169368 [Syncephalastrum racemosum]|uniref:CUE domain-containing protein n=1 Tax=Syncephalastrum racemosum TaxID=13706 RepID=A0A1X2HP46_SYNRA|nr:hypothetical protein BCR43DRAFT_169368 [Syncephalastrum racemosum]
MVDTVRAVLPDLPVSAIVADLQRTGSVDVTIDNALRDGGLPVPPPPPSPPPQQTKQTYSDLMTRYKIQQQDSATASGDEPPKIWEQTPEKRQEMLRKRKEFMVLQARKYVLYQMIYCTILCYHVHHMLSFS